MTRSAAGKKLAKKLALAFASLALAFGAAELLARLALPRPPPRLSDEGWIFAHALGERRHDPDPEIGWVLSAAPVESRHREVKDGDVLFDVVYTLGEGRRRTSARPPAPGAPKVVCTGCSFTFGHGLPDDETWPWLLQERLAACDVVDVAAMGYGTDQALMAAERELARARPSSHDVVVLGFADFQIDRVRAAQSWLVHVYPLSKPRWVADGDGVRLAGQASFHPFGPTLGRWLGRSVLLSYASSKIADRLRGTPDHGEAREITLRLIQEFDRRFAARGAELVVVVLPTHRDALAESEADQAFLVDRLQDAGIPVVLPEVERLQDGSVDLGYWIHPSDQHPNRRYDAVVAAAVAQKLGELGLAGGAEPPR